MDTSISTTPLGPRPVVAACRRMEVKPIWEQNGAVPPQRIEPDFLTHKLHKRAGERRKTEVSLTESPDRLNLVKACQTDWSMPGVRGCAQLVSTGRPQALWDRPKTGASTSKRDVDCQRSLGVFSNAIQRRPASADRKTPWRTKPLADAMRSVRSPSVDNEERHEH